jgi:hypothetical protein
MIEWIKRFFTKSEIRKADLPKCSKCGLLSTKRIEIRFIQGEEISSIAGNCCDSCEDDLSREFNPLWIPPLVFEQEK